MREFLSRCWASVKGVFTGLPWETTCVVIASPPLTPLVARDREEAARLAAEQIVAAEAEKARRLEEAVMVCLRKWRRVLNARGFDADENAIRKAFSDWSEYTKCQFWKDIAFDDDALVEALMTGLKSVKE